MQQVVRHPIAVPSITELLTLDDGQRQAIRPENSGRLSNRVSDALVNNAVQSACPHLPPDGLPRSPVVFDKAFCRCRLDLAAHRAGQQPVIRIGWRLARRTHEPLELMRRFCQGHFDSIATIPDAVGSIGEAAWAVDWREQGANLPIGDASGWSDPN
jgi:hypothetical protein